MSYSKTRRKRGKVIKRGDILFFKNSSLISKIIRVVETGKWKMEVPSHTAVVKKIDFNGIGLIEASFSGIREINLKAYKHYTMWVGTMKPPRDIDKGLEWFENSLGRPYDYSALAGILLRAGIRMFSPKIYSKVKWMKNILNSKIAFFCSEAVAWYASITGKKLCEEHFSTNTPFDVWKSDQVDVTPLFWDDIKSRYYGGVV